MMPKAYAIHTIHRRPDPKGEVEVVTAGSVFDATAEDLDPKRQGSLARDGAARPATKVDEARHAERLAAEEQRRAEIDPLAIRLDPPSPESDDLDSKTKAELRNVALERGISVEENATKAELLEALRANSDAPTE